MPLVFHSSTYLFIHAYSKKTKPFTTKHSSCQWSSQIWKQYCSQTMCFSVLSFGLGFSSEKCSLSCLRKQFDHIKTTVWNVHLTLLHTIFYDKRNVWCTLFRSSYSYGHFQPNSGHFFANHIDIFHKTEVQTVIWVAQHI